MEAGGCIWYDVPVVPCSTEVTAQSYTVVNPPTPSNGTRWLSFSNPVAPTYPVPFYFFGWSRSRGQNVNKLGGFIVLIRNVVSCPVPILMLGENSDPVGLRIIIRLGWRFSTLYLINKTAELLLVHELCVTIYAIFWTYFAAISILCRYKN